MSNFGYNQLQEELGCTTDVGFPDNPRSPITSAALKQQYDSLEANNNEDSTSSVHGLGLYDDNRSGSENVRYTALRPLSVRELKENDQERDPTDQDGTDSSILVTIDSDSKRKSIPKTYVIICGLLITCVVLVALTIICVFVILPNNRESTLHPDPRVYPADQEKNLKDLLVKTSCGLVRGTKEQDTFVFRGIQYALPPTGARRWKPPIARDSKSGTGWHDVYNATDYGNKCIQPKIGNTSLVEGSENCLYLNVWTPSLKSDSLLPVMVWFHSGDFVYGSGHVMGMSPNPQVTMATNSVYVSFNYRLGAFGFLALDELREESDGTAGNYGFMDQQLVLKWVQKNIRQFGGNKNMVTIFGHGSGATSIQAMLLSPASRGLFHKAWLTSPVAILNKTIDEACRDNKSFLKTSGCSNAQCLRKLSADIVSKSSPWALQPHWTLEQLFNIPRNSQFRNDLPIIDGHVVRWSSKRTITEGPVVPIVVGSSYFDLSNLDTEQAVINMTWDEYDQLIVQQVGVFGPEAVTRAKSLYSNKHNSEYTSPTTFPSAPSVQFSHLIGDIKNVCPVKLLVDDILTSYSNSAPIYMYVADIYPSYNIKLSSSEKNMFIGWDIAAFFGTFEDLDIIVGQGELNFQSILRQEIVSFVKSGQPDALRWKTADVNVGVIGRDVTVSPVTAEYFSLCDFWKECGFFNYTWNNSD